MDCEICANGSNVHPCPCVHIQTWTHTERLIAAQGQQRFLVLNNGAAEGKLCVTTNVLFICLCFIEFTVT